MSRHKIVKNLNLDDELDDFDGGNDIGDGYDSAEEAGTGWVEGAPFFFLSFDCGKIEWVAGCIVDT